MHCPESDSIGIGEPDINSSGLEGTAGQAISELINSLRISKKQ